MYKMLIFVSLTALIFAQETVTADSTADSTSFEIQPNLLQPDPDKLLIKPEIRVKAKRPNLLPGSPGKTASDPTKEPGYDKRDNPFYEPDLVRKKGLLQMGRDPSAVLVPIVTVDPNTVISNKEKSDKIYMIEWLDSPDITSAQIDFLSNHLTLIKALWHKPQSSVNDIASRKLGFQYAAVENIEKVLAEMSRFKWLNTEKTEKGVPVYELRFDKKDLQEKLVKIQDTKTLAPAEMEKLKSIIAKL
jgi:hypothetical protein